VQLIKPCGDFQVGISTKLQRIHSYQPLESNLILGQLYHNSEMIRKGKILDAVEKVTGSVIIKLDYMYSKMYTNNQG
jgi:hypothetical protein